MNKFISLILFFFIFSGSIKAQVLPDITVENTSGSHFYYENKGQLIDDSGIVRDDILFYTAFTQPAVYLSTNKASFVVSRIDTSSTDSEYVYDTYRIDLEFNNLSGPLTSSEQSQDSLNYYLPHCSSGITAVQGFRRIVYENAFPSIDYHFYSNMYGLKSYIVIRPGGDPNDILLKFSGQDSIQVVDSNLLLYLSYGYNFTFPEATAYQIDSLNNPISVGWDPHWVNQGGGIVSLTTSTYNTSLPLIIRIAALTTTGLSKTNTPNISGVHWSTYSGGDALDIVQDIKADMDANLYVAIEAASTNLPLSNGGSIHRGGIRDAYIAMFDNGSSLKWATFYGGKGIEIPYKISNFNLIPEIAVIGTVVASQSGGSFISDMPMVSPVGAFNQTTYGGGSSDAFIIALDKSKGIITWSTYFGGDGEENGNSIVIGSADPPAKAVYITGSTTSSAVTTNCSPSVGKFPICNKVGAYNQNFNNGSSGTNDAFIAEFNENYALVWSTMLGGEGSEYGLDIAVTGIDDGIAICGRTDSKAFRTGSPGTPFTASNDNKFPLQDNSGSFVQEPSTDLDGFITKFNGSKALVWSTFYGGSGADVLTDLAFTKYPGDNLYATGWTKSMNGQTSCTALSNGRIPICASGSQFSQSTFGGISDLVITEFNKDGQLRWSTYYGGNAAELGPTWSNQGGISIDKSDNVYIAGSSGYYTNSSGITELGTTPFANFYYQPENGSKNETNYDRDGFILGFNSSNERKWSTFFGGGCNCSTTMYGLSDEFISCISVMEGNLFIGGYTVNQKYTPYECPATTTGTPLCVDKLKGTENGFLTRFKLGEYNKFPLVIEQNITNKTNFKIYPNPVMNSLSIEIPFLETENAIIDIYDINGRLLQTKTVSGGFGIQKYVIDTHNLSKGMYFISVINDKHYATKFFKQ